ncbi:MAG: DUF2975 domain-containing protein [Pseudomonadales bacterium]|nr:DUF2975 domain-containing protein [Pseudomonadales bacterium]
MDKIRIQSCRVRMLLQCLFFAVPAFILFYWLSVGTGLDFITRYGIFETAHPPARYTDQALSLTTRFLAFLASMVPAAVVMYALGHLIRLFRGYEKGEIFTLEATTHIRKLGYSFLYWMAGSFVYSGLISVILSFNNPPGSRVLSLTFTGLDLMPLLCAFIVLIIAWVMAEAQQLADENQLTI